MIHGDFLENDLARNGKGSALYGRPMRAFKLTPAVLALRVSKPEGGRRIVSYLGAKEISWPKDISGGPEVTKQSGGLEEAQPVVLVPSLKKGSLVKPRFLHVKSVAQTTGVIGESSRGYMC